MQMDVIGGRGYIDVSAVVESRFVWLEGGLNRYNERDIIAAATRWLSSRYAPIVHASKMHDKEGGKTWLEVV